MRVFLVCNANRLSEKKVCVKMHRNVRFKRKFMREDPLQLHMYVGHKQIYLVLISCGLRVNRKRFSGISIKPLIESLKLVSVSILAPVCAEDFG